MGSIPGLALWVMDLVLLWLWQRLVAAALIRPLAWEPLYAEGAALTSQKKIQTKNKQKQKPNLFVHPTSCVLRAMAELLCRD